jgi:hypothetical protein
MTSFSNFTMITVVLGSLLVACEGIPADPGALRCDEREEVTNTTSPVVIHASLRRLGTTRLLFTEIDSRRLLPDDFRLCILDLATMETRRLEYGPAPPWRMLRVQSFEPCPYDTNRVVANTAHPHGEFWAFGSDGSLVWPVQPQGYLGSSLSFGVRTMGWLHGSRPGMDTLSGLESGEYLGAYQFVLQTDHFVDDERTPVTISTSGARGHRINFRRAGGLYSVYLNGSPVTDLPTTDELFTVRWSPDESQVLLTYREAASVRSFSHWIVSVPEPGAYAGASRFHSVPLCVEFLELEFLSDSRMAATAYERATGNIVVYEVSTSGRILRRLSSAE